MYFSVNTAATTTSLAAGVGAQAVEAKSGAAVAVGGKVLNLQAKTTEECAPCGKFDRADMVKYAEMPVNQKQLLNERYVEKTIGNMFTPEVVEQVEKVIKEMV